MRAANEQSNRRQVHARVCSSGAVDAAIHRQKRANEVWKVLEAIKDRVRAKLFRRHSGITESDGKDGDARSSCGCDVGLAVADHDRERQGTPCS